MLRHVQIIVTAVIALITLTVTTFSAWYLGPIRKRKMLWKVQSFRIIPRPNSSKKLADNMEIVVNGHAVQDPFLYRVYISNLGPKDLTSKDYDSEAPIHIYLRTKIVAEVDKSEGFRISHHDDVIQFGPDLLPSGSVAMAAVICDGPGTGIGLGSAAVESKWIYALDPAPKLYRAALIFGALLLIVIGMVLAGNTLAFINNSESLQSKLDQAQTQIDTLSRISWSGDAEKAVGKYKLQSAKEWHDDIQQRIIENRFLDGFRTSCLALIALLVPVTLYGLAIWITRRRITAFAAQQ